MNLVKIYLATLKKIKKMPQHTKKQKYKKENKSYKEGWKDDSYRYAPGDRGAISPQNAKKLSKVRIFWAPT